jgi:hypothetical protein
MKEKEMIRHHNGLQSMSRISSFTAVRVADDQLPRSIFLTPQHPDCFVLNLGPPRRSVSHGRRAVRVEQREVIDDHTPLDLACEVTIWTCGVTGSPELHCISAAKFNLSSPIIGHSVGMIAYRMDGGIFPATVVAKKEIQKE